MSDSINHPISATRWRHILLAVREILGPGGFNAILKQAALERYIADVAADGQGVEARSSELAALVEAVERVYGRSARGQLQRIGAAAFENLVESDRWGWRWFFWGLRFMSPLEKQRRILRRLMGYLSTADGKVEVYLDQQQVVVVDGVADESYGRQRVQDDSHFMIGFLQAALFRGTGEVLQIAQVSNRGLGDPVSRFEIGRPVE